MIIFTKFHEDFLLTANFWMWALFLFQTLVSERPKLQISARQRTQKTSPIGISLFQFPEIKALGEEGFSYVFEGSELLAKATEGLDPKTCKYTTTILFDYNYLL